MRYALTIATVLLILLSLLSLDCSLPGRHFIVISRAQASLLIRTPKVRLSVKEEATLRGMMARGIHADHATRRTMIFDMVQHPEFTIVTAGLTGPTLICAGAAIACWVVARRQRPAGACQACGYSLQGHEDSAATCPECGRKR